jgi:SNF2 family DNA or RNA helicase
LTRKFTPHEYQKDIIRHIVSVPRSATFASMGTGKTASTLTALEQLSLVEDVYPVLIIAPLRVAKTTWPDEVAKWSDFARLKVSVITGTAKAREAACKQSADICTINFENIPWLVAHYGDAWPFKTVVFDELTRAKSYRTRQGSKRAKALGSIAHTHIKRFIGLTGTPSPNGLADLWGQMWFLDRGDRLGRTYSAFEARWFTKGWDGFSIKPMAHSQKEIEDKIKDLCLTVTGLPVDEPIYNPIYVDLPPDARALYRDMEKEMFAEIEEFGVEALNAAARTTKIHQISNGALYVDDKGDWREVHKAKIEALESIIEEAAGMPVLVAYHFKSDLARLQAAFPQAKVLDANPKTIHDWNEGKIPILLAHPASGGHGLSLQYGSNIMAFFSVSWNLEEHMQIIERIGPQRQAQAGFKRPVFVHYILAKDTVDEMILERLKTKKTVQNVLLDAMKRRPK